MWISSPATAYDGDGGRRVTHSWTVRRCLPNWREPNRGCCRVNFPHDYAGGVREASGLQWNDRCDTGANARAALPCLGSFWRGLLKQDRRTATINAVPRAFPWPTSQVTDEANRIRRRADNGDEVRHLRRRDDSPGGWRLHFTCMGAIAVECLMRARRIQQKTSKSPVQNDFPRDQRVTGHGRLVLITHI
jgi:hypothetical protein